MAVKVTTRANYRKRSIFGLVGLLLISCVALLVGVGLGRGSQAAQTEVVTTPIVAQFDTVSIPVPANLVAAGTKLRNVQFRSVSFPKHQIPLGALLEIDQYLESVTLTPLPANLPIFRDNLSITGGALNPVIERIPAGMRAMTIKVDATSSVEGWAGSGSIVDVLLVTDKRTSVVAEKVRILSAERSVSPVDGAASPNVPSTVTLLVTQDQCLAINTAIPMGRIAFALRSTKDEEGWTRTSYTREEVQTGAGRTEFNKAINGFLSVKDKKNGSERTAFALTDGKWVKTELVPDGFFPAKDSRDLQ